MGPRISYNVLPLLPLLPPFSTDVLEIVAADEGDSGVYICTANGVSGTFTLSIEGPPSDGTYITSPTQCTELEHHVAPAHIHVASTEIISLCTLLLTSTSSPPLPLPSRFLSPSPPPSWSPPHLPPTSSDGGGVSTLVIIVVSVAGVIALILFVGAVVLAIICLCMGGGESSGKSSHIRRYSFRPRHWADASASHSMPRDQPKKEVSNT